MQYKHYKTLRKIIFWFVLTVILLTTAYGIVAFNNPAMLDYISSEIFFIIENGLFIILLISLFLVRKSIFPDGEDDTEKLYGDTQISYIRKPPIEQNYDLDFLLENIPDLVCIKDEKGRWLKASPEYLNAFQLNNTHYIGKTALELSMYPDCDFAALQFDAGQDKKAWEEGIAVQDNSPDHPLPETIHHFFIRIPTFTTQGQRFRLFVYLDHSKPQEPSDSKLLSSVFNTSPLPFLVLNNEFQIIKSNKAFSLPTGMEQADLINKDLFSLYAKKGGNESYYTLKSFFLKNPDQPWTDEFRCLRKRGDNFPAKITILPIPQQAYAEDYYLASIIDITQQKKEELRLAKIANYDDLTGLPKRNLFREHLITRLNKANRNKTNLIVLIFELSRFKTINDSLGHSAGDDLLKEVAQRLVNYTVTGSFIARLSGNEFAMILDDEPSHEKAIYAATIAARRIINELSKQFHIHRQDVFVGVSVGITIYPEDGTTDDLLLKHADIAMSNATNKGHNNFSFFNRSYIEDAQKKHQLELSLHKALEKEELALYYQPQISTNSGELWGAEVLIRWFQKTADQRQPKMVSPADFIPIAEETGLVIPIGQWILETACAQQKAWLENGQYLKQVAVNVSAKQFMDPNFVDIVETALRKAELDPNYLELEVTESMLVGDTKKIELQLGRLKKMGIQIALDDFGTGYSSLSYLKKLPIDILKVDQSFIRELTTEDSKDAQIVRAIISMGHSLGQKIVAEGVETDMQLNYLRKQGCDVIQGYYFSKPLPAHEMTRFIADNNVAYPHSWSSPQ